MSWYVYWEDEQWGALKDLWDIVSLSFLFHMSHSEDSVFSKEIQYIFFCKWILFLKLYFIVKDIWGVLLKKEQTQQLEEIERKEKPNKCLVWEETLSIYIWTYWHESHGCLPYSFTSLFHHFFLISVVFQECFKRVKIN